MILMEYSSPEACLDYHGLDINSRGTNNMKQKRKPHRTEERDPSVPACNYWVRNEDTRKQNQASEKDSYSVIEGSRLLTKILVVVCSSSGSTWLPFLS